MTRHNDIPLACVFTLLLSSLYQVKFKDQWVCSLGAVCRQTTFIWDDNIFHKEFIQIFITFQNKLNSSKILPSKTYIFWPKSTIWFGTLILFSKLIIYVYVQYSNLSKECLRDDAENHKSKEWEVSKFMYRK